MTRFSGMPEDMPEVRSSDPNPDDLTPEEQDTDPTQDDDVTENPEEQTGG